MKTIRSLVKTVPFQSSEAVSVFKKIHRTRPDEILGLEETPDWWDITNMLFDEFEDKSNEDFAQIKV